MSNNFDWEEKTWDVLDAYYANRSVLVKHHIESYNNFIEIELPNLIKREGKKVIKFNFNKKIDRFMDKYTVEFDNVYITKPVINENNGIIKQMYPNEARLRNLTYSSPIYCDISQYRETYNDTTDTYDRTNLKSLIKFNIGKIPIMLQSKFCILSDKSVYTKVEMGECKYDYGGYFIINGSEKVLICQEKKCENKVYVFPSSRAMMQKYSHIAEITSISINRTSGSVIKAMIITKESSFGKTIKITLNRVRTDIPFAIIFKAMGVITDKEIVTYICGDLNSDESKQIMKIIRPSLEEASSIENKTIAIEYISNYISVHLTHRNIIDAEKYKLRYVEEIIRKNLFPHLGDNLTKKIFFLGHMIKKLVLNYMGKLPSDDRDSFINKRLDTSGSLMASLFRDNFIKMIRDMKILIDKDINANRVDDLENLLIKKIKSNTLETNIKYALATGNWGIKTRISRKGIAQVLDRLTYLSTLSHLRRVMAPGIADASSKQVEPRKLHNTQWGILCPNETPEGGSIGVVKNLAMMSCISYDTNPEPVYKCLVEYGCISLDELEPNMLNRYLKVFVNGDWSYVHNNSKILYNKLLKMRRYGVIHIYTSITWNREYKELYINTDYGRILRPLYIVENNKLKITNNNITDLKNNKITWDDLLINKEFVECSGNNELNKSSCIEYIDVSEADTCMMAMTLEDLNKNKRENDSFYNYTHCEIHPAMILGALVSNIPFSNHNQAPRNLFQGAMGKQSLGVYSTNFKNRMDTMAHILHYPQKPLVNTKSSDFVHSNEIPAGQNAIVAIACYTGYNQEDSLIFNKSAVDRGLFKSTYYRTYKEEEKKNQTTLEEEKFGKPIKYNEDGTLLTSSMKAGSYDKLSDDGFIKENVHVKKGDIIIGKTTPIKGAGIGEPKFKDSSVAIKKNDTGIIDKVYVNKNGDGYRFCKVRIRNDRKPIIGDKFASRHGQKGTIGILYNQEDMPYTESGIVPDLIVNPFAIPKRMTVAHLIECVSGKMGSVTGNNIDATPFNNTDVHKISEILTEKCGYKSSGKELMYNGKTGEQIMVDIFIGPTFYYRLKHMVLDKRHSRDTGPYQLLTRQPAEGRARDGGLRFGEMERDCLLVSLPVSLNIGLSVKIGDMKNCDHEVLGWSSKLNGMVKSKQTGFKHKGTRECVRLMLENGKTVECTPDHPILTSTNKWVKAKDLKINETRVKTSLTYPVIDMADEIKECNNWKLEVGGIELRTDTKKDYLEAMAFARIIGLLITDGHIDKNDYKCAVYFGHLIDTRQFLDDLYLWCDIIPKVGMSMNTYTINIPSLLASSIVQLKGLEIGKKVTQEAQLPDFILDPDCPRPIVREFLGGVFGGDGHTCVLAMHRGKRDILTSISISQSKKEQYLPSLETKMKNMEKLLNKCGIHKITIQKLKETTQSKKKCAKGDKTFQLLLHLDINELVPFSEKIGFRYCCHKSQRLEAGVSYKLLRDSVVRQHNWIVAKVDELTDYKKKKMENPKKNIRTKKQILEAIKILEETEPLIHKYAIPTTHDISDHLIKGTKFGSFRSKSFPTAEQYLTEIGAIDWFKNHNYGQTREIQALETMNLKVIDIRPIGEHEVCDIQVDDTYSFIANGIVAHNCMLAHGTVQFLKERLYDTSDKFQVHVCKKTGMIAAANPSKNVYKSLFDPTNNTDFAKVRIPYASKLFLHELMSMGIAPHLYTNSVTTKDDKKI